MEQRNKSLGLTAIFLGIIFLLENLKIFQFNFINIWPEVVVLVGIGFAVGYFLNRKSLHLIMPATVLIIYGILFSYCNISSWGNMAQLWPILLLAPGFGFFLLYVVAVKEASSLWAGSILFALGLLFLLRHVAYLRYWPALLIIGGVVLVLFPAED